MLCVWLRVSPWWFIERMSWFRGSGGTLAAGGWCPALRSHSAVTSELKDGPDDTHMYQRMSC